MRETLAPFAEAADFYDPPENGDQDMASHHFPIGALRRARAQRMGEPQDTRPRATIGEMKTSEGTDYLVMLEFSGRKSAITKLPHRWQAEYERDYLNWMLAGGEKPRPLNYGRAAFNRATPYKGG